RSEEKCLVRSGLVQLMDRLCSLSGQRDCSSNDKQTKKQKVATMAWAAFQVLANRCIEWEKVEGGSTDAVHSGLARQVSSLLTNHLARATECCGNQAAGNDALQDVLSLLNDLSRSHIGKAILSQPACVSKLLSLLLDQRPSPKLVLIILQLCRAALPLMSVEDCGNVELPPWSYSIHTLDNEQEDSSDPASKIASLLLAKLADYVVPGCQTLLSPSSSEPDTSLTRASPKSSLKVEKDAGEEGEAVDGKLSIFIHKREDQSSHEVLQPLLSSSEGRPFRLGTGANMEKVVKMDRDMTKSGHCEVITEEAAAALRKATKWAQSGLIVSVGPPVETLSQENASGLSTGDKKKTAQTAICRERNTELARSDPVRPFISGHVANSMAAEVIALLHGLLTAPESNTAQIWTSTAEKVLSRALMYIPQLGKYAESILENGSSSGRKLARLQATARQAVAALCALGGFKETIKIGSEVQVVGKGILGSVGVVMSINEQEGIATVKFPSSDYRKDCKASDVLTVPISRLCTPRSEALPLYKLSITEKVVQAVQSMLLPQEGSLSIHTSLPASGDGSSPVMAAVRLLAEIRTRACLVMAQLLEDSSFCEEFIQQCPAAVEVLNLVAQECSPGERLSVVEAQCERVRMLYRDCARPPPPPLQTDRTQPKEITWSPSRVFPPVRACMFSSRLTSVTFLADPSAGGGLPRGTFIYATSPVPVQAPSFYWEIEIVSYGDSDDDSGPIVSFGFATEAEKRDGAWTNPVGTCLFHNNGRAVHYNGSSLLQWKSVRLDVALVPGDVAGIGWERSEGTPPPPGQAAKGRVYFTYCGQRLAPFLEDVSGGMWPLVHIQKKNTKIRANFGCRPFAFAEGQAHRNAADMCIDLAEEISANFEALPFAMASDSDNDAGASVASDPGSHGPPCRIAAVATALQQYNSGDSCHYKLELSYENLITSGPDPHPPPIADDEDHYALLVKAWETKVFPTIRRRFRNEAERKSGLDQIKGALQLGMVDIARQTVEFLYEENGGIPRDLYLPTIEDIKDEANKFTIDKVRKGLTVVIRCPDSNNTNSTTGGTALPKFAIRGMLKTFGLHGVVLDVDSMNELVQVETYLRSEGVLVRYWYPIDMLERPPAGSRRTAANGLVTLDSTNIQIHRELLRCEGALARLYCRMALLNIFAPKSPHTFTRLFHIPAIRDITLEHLQLLSNQLLAPPLPDGTISSSSILLAQSLQHIIQGQNCSPTDLFYQGNAQPIREWLTVAITRALHQGEESLLDLTKQICSFLQNAPEQFPSEEFPVSESKVSMDVNFPGAAFVVISCKESTQGFRKDSSLYKAPWARVMIYGLGHKVRRNGQLNLMEAVCYPLDASPSNTGLTPPPTTNQYPSAIIPTDKVHIKLGVSPPPGAVLVLHSLPLEFPLAMAFAEQLLTWKLGEGNGRSEDELDTIPASVLLQVVELLGIFSDLRNAVGSNTIDEHCRILRNVCYTMILRKYGVSKPNKSKYSKASKEQHQGKVVSTKRPITKPPTKEKSVLNTVSRTALSEKKPIVKPKSPEKSRPEEKDSEKSPTKKQEVPEEKYLTLEGFHRFAVDRAKQDIRSVWRAILACGYDLHFERCTCIDTRHAQKACRRWSLEMDVALVQYVNRLCRHLAITPARLHPHEVYLDPADTADPRVSCLLNVPMESLRLRFALLQSLNNTLETFFLPLVELRATDTYQHSIASMLREAKGLVFYDTKVAVMNRVLNATVQRTADHAAPEITLDPLEIVGGEIRSSENTYFCQAARQLACVPSSQLCVKLASGGDPTYAFNIRFTGEEVHGTSGSFRHFLWQVCKELQSSALSLLLPCPSSAANRNKGKYILTPSPITYAEEQLLHFFGQLLGIAIRADVPLPLDLLPSFWKGLVGEVLDEDTDLQEADLLTSNYIKKFESVNDEAELDALCAEITSQHHSSESPESPNKPCCKFTYVTMMGDEVELCSGGRNITVGWENKDMYASAIRSLRMRELQSSQCMTAVRAGLDSIIPLQLLTMLTPLEMELRTCGLPYINLEFLKAHTMYQVGLMETDQHIEFFWTALEMFTQEELCKFIKFACNQERIPFTCPCKDGGPDTAHVPPYPMKIAPPDGAAGSPDSRYIRVETCMFMIKLPQYSSLEVMLEKLRYAIHYREDPLSG
uniref:HECT domain E3 ubiquitin protein ligase 4 n=1 Tax=Lepisosteus oculatus TaxID=7918 RepID=W5MLW8_LEPOC